MGRNSVEDDNMVALNFSLICLTKETREFRIIIGMLMLNSVSRTSNDLTLAGIMWPREFKLKSWPTVLKPAWWRLRARLFRKESEEISSVLGDSSYPIIGISDQYLSY